MGCDSNGAEIACKTKVSIHAPTWGATLYPPNLLLFQYVSIHAPTWGATSAKLVYSNGQGVSIHAPTWGATSDISDKRARLQFQSTHPHGVRLGAAADVYFDSKVSIHAPTWGATHIIKHLRQIIKCFNPRTHMGCDTLNSALTQKGCLFQSTHPHGVRRHLL